MLGATLQIARGHGEDRFYSPSKTLRGYHQHLQCLWQSRSNSSAGIWSIPPLVFNEKASVLECLEPEDQTGSEVGPSNDRFVSASSSSLCSSLASENSRSSNLDRFLHSTTPSIAAQFFYKVAKCCFLRLHNRLCDVCIKFCSIMSENYGRVQDMQCPVPALLYFGGALGFLQGMECIWG